MYIKNTALICLLAAFFAVIVSAQTSSDVKLPDTPAGQAIKAFLAAFNTGDIEAMRSFHSERSGDLENAQQDMEFYQQCSGLKLHSVIQSSEHEIELLPQAKNDGRWLSFKMHVDPNPPHAVDRIGVQPASAPSGALSSEAPRNDPAKPAPVAKKLFDDRTTTASK